MKQNEVKLFIGTPAQKDVTQQFYVSMIGLAKNLTKMNIPFKTQGLFGSCYIEWARNELTHYFLNDKEEEWTHLLFIDSDIGFNTDDVLELIKHSDNEEHLIVGGLYPKKELDYNLLHYLVTQGCPPDQLQYFIGNTDYDMFSPIDEIKDPTKPVSVKHLPTGFMLINRKVFSLFKHEYPEIEIMGHTYFDGDHKMDMYFQTGIFKAEDGHKHYYGEDTNFCNMWRKIGGKIWALPWVSLIHVGNHPFKRQMLTGNPNA